ncbi:hypothetical protein ABR759_00555 [Escherichia coli]
MFTAIQRQMIRQLRIFTSAESDRDSAKKTSGLQSRNSMLNFFRLTAPREIEIPGRNLPEIDLDFVASRRKAAGQRSNGAVKNTYRRRPA